MKLTVVLTIFHTGPTQTTWYQTQLWALAEHGLSLFAAAVLAIRPIFAYVSSSIINLSTSIRRKSGSGSGSISISGTGAGIRPGSDGVGTTRVMTKRLVGFWIQPFKPLLFSTPGRGRESRGGSASAGGAGGGGAGQGPTADGNGSTRPVSPSGWEDMQLNYWEEKDGKEGVDSLA